MFFVRLLQVMVKTKLHSELIFFVVMNFFHVTCMKIEFVNETLNILTLVRLNSNFENLFYYAQVKEKESQLY